jgi:UDP-N-acetylglucosamine transferase subunit ALG13
VIFVTVGTQLAFDRMIEAVDEWAGANPGVAVFAQIGPGEYRPRHIGFSAFVSPQECKARMRESEAIVAHAGMGTILSALELGKPLLVMPRHASLGEHRNDHQIATAERFGELGRVTVAADAAELKRGLDDLGKIDGVERISPFASERLIGALSSFIQG